MVSLANTIEAHAGIVDSAGDIGQWVRHFFDVGAIVYRKSDYTQAPGAQQSLVFIQYKVLSLQEISFWTGTEYKYQSQVANIAALCLGAPCLDPEDQLDDVTTPLFYRLKRLNDNTFHDLVIETDVRDEAGITDYIEANIPNWIEG